MHCTSGSKKTIVAVHLFFFAHLIFFAYLCLVIQ